MNRSADITRPPALQRGLPAGAPPRAARRHPVVPLLAVWLSLSFLPLRAAAADDAVRLTMDSPFLQLSGNEEGDEVRWLSVFITVDNQTNQELRVPATAWRLRDSRGTHAPAPMTDTFDWLEVVDGEDLVSLTELRPRERTIAAGGHERIGLFFQPLALDLKRPDLTLTLTINGRQQATLDIAQAAADALQLKTRRIGPGGAIGLVQLSGELNSLNAGQFVRHIDELSGNQRVLRYVVEVAADTRIPDPKAVHWLRQLAELTGLGELYDDRFAALPNDLLALHLTQAAPADNAAPARDRLLADYYDHVHPDLAAAVEAAVAPLCEQLPRELLLQELRDGEPVSQQAVLRHCGERLVDEDLPVVLAFLQSPHASLRLAALDTLRHFETPAAIAALKTAAASTDAETSSAALAAMATSRYGRVRDELLALLDTAAGPLQQRAVDALARHPQPDWAPKLATLARHSDPAIRRVALTGLVALGHPQLNQFLREGLASDDDALRALSLRHLMASPDPDNERIALAAVLADLQTRPPSAAATRFLQRVRDPRSIPLLRPWLKSDTPRVRRRVVQTLLATGDPDVLEELAAQFDDLGATEQADILTSLFHARSPRFEELIPGALRSKRGRLLDVALELLRRDGSDQSVALLAAPLADADFATSRRVLGVCQTLAAIATPAARDLLIQHAVSEHATLRDASAAALQQLYARSPAMPFLMRGVSLLEDDRGATLAMLHFNLAIEADPQHPSSRSARADIALKNPQPSEAELQSAREDLIVAARYDPSSTMALTCLGLTEVRLGAIDTGVRLVESARDRFVNDPLYHYNTACIYGRAIEALETQLTQQPSQAEALRARIETYRSQALTDLRSSIDSGLDEHNRNWMREDPDLATIRQAPGFEYLFEDNTALPPIPDELK